MMKITHISTVHNPQDPRIFQRQCKTLAAHDYQVSIIAQGAKDYEVDGIFIKTIGYAKSRLHRLLVLQLKALAIAIREPAEVYHIHDPELIIMGCVLKLLGKRVVYDAHEELTHSLQFKNYIPKIFIKPLSFVTAFLNNLASYFFNVIVVATPKIANDFNSQKTYVIKNYPPVVKFPKLTKEKYQTNELLCTYIGRISLDRGLQEIINAVKTVTNSIPARLNLAGKFDPAILEKNVKHESAFIEYYGNCLWPEIPYLLEKSRIGLVILHPYYINNYPLKLFEYMAAGIPVVASDFPLWREFVEQNKCGILVNPFDVKAISDAIHFLFQNPDTAYEMGNNGRNAIEKYYNWEAEGEKLLDIYKKLLT